MFSMPLGKIINKPDTFLSFPPAISRSRFPFYERTNILSTKISTYIHTPRTTYICTWTPIRLHMAWHGMEQSRLIWCCHLKHATRREGEPYYLFDLEIWLVYHWSTVPFWWLGISWYSLVLYLLSYRVLSSQKDNYVSCVFNADTCTNTHTQTHTSKEMTEKETKHGNGTEDVTRQGNFTRRNEPRSCCA